MNAIIDPQSSTAMCGVCGEVYALLDFADECCVVAPQPARWRIVVAGGLVLASLIFLFGVLPFL